MLLHKRLACKYLSAGLRINACCSHPLPKAIMREAAEKRLKEEIGFTPKLSKAIDFIHRSLFDNGLIEYAYDLVFIGNYVGEIKPDKNEVSDFFFM